MTDNVSGTPSGAPGGTPAGNAPAPSNSTPDNTGGSFVRDRVRQMAETMQPPAPSDNTPAGDTGRQQQQQQTPPAEQKIRVGDDEYSAQELNELRAFKAERDIRKNLLPKSEAEYQIKLPDNFQPPPGVTFEFDANSPELAQARKIALARGVDQDTFSEFLGAYAASKITEQTNIARSREANLAQLGPAGPQRIDAVATWLAARAGAPGKQVANFIRQFPSAPIVATMETLIKQFSSQGGADFSQSHRTEQEDPGKIAGYENMNFVQRRVHQMAQRMLQPGYRGDGGRRGE